MDKLIYTAMTGARHILEKQATNSHNLANVSTNGFRAQLDSFRAVPVVSSGLPTRTMVVDSTVGSDFTPGAIQHTGRELDVALHGPGWIAVQMPDGSEAYTRHGALKVSENGLLQTASGLNVQGEGGPITITPEVSISIGRDGTISGIANGFKPGASTEMGRIKLVNPPPGELERGADGLFRLKNGQEAEVDPTVKIAGGALEGSNVNMIDCMVDMISIARQFETQMSLLKNAENNAAKAGQILSLN
ncbi:flagellar basal-body rod protein FlgF [Massilia sp. W12]|uniref:flagellar basal-body rod protein FlgF n=1 Tax=Massilia sp. W12 TaxID=3126507 RepID=UPI0030CF010E